MIARKCLQAATAAVVVGAAATACGKSPPEAELRASIRIESVDALAGPTRAIAREFELRNPGVEIAVVRARGSAAGIGRLCAGSTDIVGAARAIRPAEAAGCERAGVDFGQLAVADQALVVLLNDANPQTCVRIEQLAQIWRREAPVENWTDVVNGVGTLSAPIERFAPAPDSPAAGFFTATVNGREGRQTSDYHPTGEDGALVAEGVSAAPGGIGYANFGSFAANTAKVRAADVESRKAGICVRPDEVSVRDGSYRPLSRTLFLHASVEALGDRATRAFLAAYLERIDELAPAAGLLPISARQREATERRLRGSG